MVRMRRRFLRLMLMPVTLTGAVAIVVPANAAEFVKGPPKTELTSFEWGAPRGRTFRVVVQSGYCFGETRPRLRTIHVERPASRKFRHGAIVVTASVIRPAPLEVTGETIPGEPVPVCNGRVVTLEKTLTLKHVLLRQQVLERLGSELKPAKRFRTEAP